MELRITSLPHLILLPSRYHLTILPSHHPLTITSSYHYIIYSWSSQLHNFTT
ncbi:hypothetical protein QO190_12995 [Cloacibacterium sp. Arc13]|uniref:hypothetical protein n=1 Tax=unclassified Cloacibacterium TaxID=2620870 RepID=UPI00352C48F4